MFVSFFSFGLSLDVLCENNLNIIVLMYGGNCEVLSIHGFLFDLAQFEIDWNNNIGTALLNSQRDKAANVMP